MGRGKILGVVPFSKLSMLTCLSQINENHEALKQKWNDVRKALD